MNSQLTNYVVQHRSAVILSRFFETITTFATYLFVVLSGIVLMSCLVMIALQPVQAAEPRQESIQHLSKVRLDESRQGSLLFAQQGEKGVYASAPVVKTDVSMDIAGMLAHVKVEQQFTNSTAQWQEGIYVFPLPDDSAVDRLRMKIGERIIEGKIKEKGKARKHYEKAKREGKKAALVEQQRPNMFTNSVANIGPGESITVTIHYQQRLAYVDGEFSLRFPMIVNPRYIPKSDESLDLAINEVTSQSNEISDFSQYGWGGVLARSETSISMNEYSDVPASPVTIHIKLDAGLPLTSISSPYHKIDTQEKDGKHTIRLAEGVTPGDRDFVLRWRPTLKKAPQAALFSEIRDEEKYALLMFMPPHPQNVRDNISSRELIFIIDTSGSMGGASIRQARQALQLAIKKLTPEDRFNIIQFNSYTSQLYPNAVSANRSNINQALRYINSLNASGGTEMLPALQAALPLGRHADSSKGNHVRQVVFLTDGSVSNEFQLFELIKNRLGDSRLFTIGIGSAPNSHFMNKAARYGRGTYTYIGDPREVEEKIQSLFKRIEAPVLTDIKLEWMSGNRSVYVGEEGLDNSTVQSYPSKYPDLYAGEPLIVSMRLPEKVDGLQIKGMINTHGWQRNLKLTGGAEKAGVAKRWARERIASLLESVHDGADRNTVRNAVIKTALAHHLVSKYTSLVAVDVTPSRPINKKLSTNKVKTPLPAGADKTKMLRLPKTATPARMHFMLALISLVLAMASLIFAFSGIPGRRSVRVR